MGLAKHLKALYTQGRRIRHCTWSVWTWGLGIGAAGLLLPVVV